MAGPSSQWDAVVQSVYKRVQGSSTEQTRHCWGFVVIEMQTLPTGTTNGKFEQRRHARELKEMYSNVDIPDDIAPASFFCNQRKDGDVNSNTPNDLQCNFFVPFESSGPTTEATNIVITNVCSVNEEEEMDATTLHSSGTTADIGTNKRKRNARPKREPTAEDRNYRADREYVKRRSHQKMIWFFRNLNIRHPAAIRMHLEKARHIDFELPNLQCVYPHKGLSVACEDSGLDTAVVDSSVTANVNYYNIYCATPSLVERVRRMMDAPIHGDPDYNKKVVTFIADLVGRLLWSTKRIHAVMFAKSDHLDRDCFLLYSRQVEQTPFSMSSDTLFCRRHDSERYKSIVPQSDLTRANSSRVSNESCIYIVGCDISEVYGSFPFEYRTTNCRPMKSLYERVKQVDPAVLQSIFSPINAYVNGCREDSPYVEEASATSFDVLSAMLRDPETRDITSDDSTVFRDCLERFLLLAIMNVHMQFRLRLDWKGRRGNDTRHRSVERMNSVVLHHVKYRREVRSIRTNRIYYYRNSNDYICSHSLLDDRFEDRHVVDEAEVLKRKPVYFYDVMQLFEYEKGGQEWNSVAMYSWNDAVTMIHESSHTIGQRLTPDVLRSELPADPFYPPSNMSPVDLSIDQMLERAIKHAKKIKLPTSPTRDGPGAKKKGLEGAWKGTGSTATDGNYERFAIRHSMSRLGGNRLGDGYRSPRHQSFEASHVENGERVSYRIKVGLGETSMTRVDYGEPPRVQVYDKLLFAYLIDPTQAEHVRLVPGCDITDPSGESYVPLTLSDRIVRVFCIEYVKGATYLIKPFIFIVFRNMPYTVIKNDFMDNVVGSLLDYNAYQGFGIFDDGEGVEIKPHMPNGHHEEQDPLKFDEEQNLFPEIEFVDGGGGAEQNQNVFCETTSGEDVFHSLLSTVDWKSLET